MQTITTAADIKTWITNENPGNVLAEPALVEQLAEAIRTADGRPAWGENWQEWLDGNAERLAYELGALTKAEEQRADAALREQGLEPVVLTFSAEAQRNIEETGCDPMDDMHRVVTGEQTREGLLAFCLDGAEEDRVQGWRDYVQTICEAAARPAELFAVTFTAEQIAELTEEQAIAASLVWCKWNDAAQGYRILALWCKAQQPTRLSGVLPTPRTMIALDVRSHGARAMLIQAHNTRRAEPIASLLGAEWTDDWT